MNSWLAALLSAICFSFMSLFVKLAIEGGIASLDLVFYRFIFGSTFFVLFFSASKKKFRVQSWKFSLLRAFSNILAVSLLYISISYLDLGTANLLNLTYPIFISILSPLLLKEKSNIYHYIAVTLSSIGVALLLVGEASLDYQIGIAIGLACGFTSALTLMTLKRARDFDDSTTIVAVLMIVGSVVLLPLYSFTLPKESYLWLWILGSAFMALTGQLFITYSFRRLSSFQGSLMSSSRILFSYALGIGVLGDFFHINFVFSFLLISFAIYLAKKKA